MGNFVKYLGHELHRFYSGAIRWPLNWRMIDALESLDEASQRSPAQPDAGKEPPQSKREGEDSGGARL